MMNEIEERKFLADANRDMDKNDRFIANLRAEIAAGANEAPEHVESTENSVDSVPDTTEDSSNDGEERLVTRAFPDDEAAAAAESAPAKRKRKSADK